MSAASLNTDAFPPDLMQELQAVRGPFQAAYEELWRRERAFRYVYWLQHREHPPFNLIGSWTTSDMNAEMALWQRMHRDRLDNTEVLDLVTGLLEQRFGLSCESMLERASHCSLAELGLPIWNRPTASLIPQAFGNWRITGMTDYGQPALGISYSYRHIEVHSTLSLYVYDHGLSDIQSGLSDPRFGRAAGDLHRQHQLPGTRVRCRTHLAHRAGTGARPLPTRRGDPLCRDLVAGGQPGSVARCRRLVADGFSQPLPEAPTHLQRAVRPVAGRPE